MHTTSKYTDNNIVQTLRNRYVCFNSQSFNATLILAHIISSAETWIHANIVKLQFCTNITNIYYF